jgi:hypothetical protein
MKKHILSAAIIIGTISMITSCKKSDDDDTSDQGNAGTPKETALLAHKWDLNAVVNISDEDKYLHTTLSFAGTKSFSNIKQDGNTAVSSGDWSIEGDSLKLTETIFHNGGTSTYFMNKLSADELVLFEHYTLGGKNAILEYHYKAK